MLSPKVIKLTASEIKKFQMIVKQVKNIDLTFNEAEDQAMRFVKAAILLRQKRLLESQKN